MTLKDLVVTGAVKLLRLLKVETLVVEKINDITKTEIDTLKGVTENISTQMQSVQSDLNAAETLRTSFKTNIANSINNIPKVSTETLTADSTLGEMTTELTGIKTTIEQADTVEGDVLQDKKFVNNQGHIVKGTMKPHTSHTYAVHIGLGDDYMSFGTELGAYCEYADWDGYQVAQIVASYDDVATCIGIDWDKMIDTAQILNKQGTIKNMSGYTDASSIGMSDTELFLRIPKGAYITASGGYSDDNGDYPEIKTPLSSVRDVAGLTAADIRSGLNAMGVTGTYTDDGTIVASKVLNGYVGYSKGTKVVGTMVDYTGRPDHIGDCTLDDTNKWFKVAVHRGFHNFSWAENSFEYMTYDEVASKIGLTAGDIKSGQTVLGITGTYDDDGTVSSGDILDGKVAYSKGYRMVGTIPIYDLAVGEHDRTGYNSCYGLSSNNTEDSLIVVMEVGYYAETIGGIHEIVVPWETIRSLIGLTSDKIVKGYCIMGIDGEYENPLTSVFDEIYDGEPDSTIEPDSYVEYYKTITINPIKDVACVIIIMTGNAKVFSTYTIGYDANGDSMPDTGWTQYDIQDTIQVTKNTVAFTSSGMEYLTSGTDLFIDVRISSSITITFEGKYDYVGPGNLNLKVYALYK